MAATVNVGTLEGLLRWKADDADVQRSLNTIASKANISRTTLFEYGKELVGVEKAYKRVAASIDPAVAAEQKLETATRALNAALKANLIDQQKYNAQLDLARAKYTSAQNPLDLLKGRVGELSGKVGELGGVIARFGGSAGAGLASVASSLTGIGSAATGAIASLGPLLPVIAGLAAAAALVTVGFKGFEALKDIVSDGMETEKILNKLNATMKLNGSISGMSSRQLNDQAEKWALLTGRQDDEILTMDTVLSRYDKLTKDTFPRAQVAALNLAKITGGDLAGASEKVGILLSGGTRSLNAFREAGIVLTAGQTTMLKKLVETGQGAEYVAKVMELLEGKLGTNIKTADTLEKGMKNVRYIYGEFREAIAGELIPALEHFFYSLVKQLGGWENILIVATKVGGVISRTLANMVYSAETAYHAWMVATGTLVTTLSRQFGDLAHTILEIPLRIADGFSKLPIPIAPAFAAAAAGIRQMQMTTDALFLGAEAKSRAFLQSQKSELADTIKSWKEHKSAVEGTDEIYKRTGNATSDLVARNKELEAALKAVNSAIDAATKAYDSLNNTIDAQAQKIGEEISDRTRLISALMAGTDAYEKERVAIAAEKQIRSDLAAVQKSYQAAVEAANKAVDLATEKFGAQSAKALEARTILAQIVATYGSAVSGLKELSAANIASARALEEEKQKWKDIDAAVKSYGAAIEAVLKRTAEFNRQLAVDQASLADQKARIDLETRYGTVVADLAVRLGAVSDSTRKVRIEAEALNNVRAAARQGLTLDLEAEIQKLTLQDAQLQAIKKQQALLEIKADVWRPVTDGFQTASGIILDGIFSWKGSAKDVASDIAHNLIDFLVKAFQEILQRWITLQMTMAAVERSRLLSNAAIGNASAASGAGVTGLQSVGLTSIGSATTGNASMGASLSQWGTYAAYGFLAWVGFKIVEGWTKARTKYGEASIGGSTSGDRRIASQISQTITDLVQQVTDLALQWHLGLVSLTRGSVTIGANSDGSIIVKSLIDNVGRVFKTMSEALDYAKVQALKFATFSDQVSELVKAAILKSRATTTEGLQADIDFANRLVTQNLSEIEQQFHSFLQTFVEDFHHLLDLFGPGSLRSLSDFTQLGAAAESAITSLLGGIQGMYDQLTGHKVDQDAIDERNRVAFNAQRAIVIAQLTLLYEEIKARIAEYQVRLRILQSGVLGGGGGTDAGTPNTNDSGSRSKGGGVLTRDDRNPTGDSGLAALLQVLDNLARAMQGLPPEIAPGGVHRGGGGRGAASRDSVQSFIDDRRFQLSLSALDDFHRQLKQIEHDYAAQITAAGKDKKLREQLLALQQQETAAAVKAHEEEVAARQAELRTEFGRLVAPDAFEQATRQFEDMKKEIEKAGFGADETAKMIAGLTAAEIDAINKLADQQFSSLVGDLSNIIAESETNAEQNKLHNELLRAQEIINYQMKMVQLRADYAIVRAKGLLTQQELALLDKAFGWIDANANILPGGADWAPSFERVSTAASDMSSAAANQNDAADRLRTAVESLIDYQTSLHTDASLGLVDPRTALDNSRADYEANRVKALAGDVDAISKFKDFAETYRRNLVGFSPSSELTASVLSGIDDTINRIRGLRSVQAALSSDGQAIVGGLNAVSSGVAMVYSVAAAVNDNTKETKDAIQALTPDAIADAAKSKQADYLSATLAAQQSSAAALRTVSDDIKALGANILAWRTESRGNVDEAYGQLQEANGKLAAIAANTKHARKLAGTGG